MDRKMMRVSAKQHYHRLILLEFKSGRARVLSDEEARSGFFRAYRYHESLLRLYIRKHRNRSRRKRPQ